MTNGASSSPSSHSTPLIPVAPGRTIAPSSMASSGSCVPLPLGVACLPNTPPSSPATAAFCSGNVPASCVKLFSPSMTIFVTGVASIWLAFPRMVTTSSPHRVLPPGYASPVSTRKDPGSPPPPSSSSPLCSKPSIAVSAPVSHKRCQVDPGSAISIMISEVEMIPNGMLSAWSGWMRSSSSPKRRLSSNAGRKSGRASFNSTSPFLYSTHNFP